MNGIMDSVEVELFRTLSNTQFVLASASLSHHTLLKVGLGVPYYIAQQLSELCAVLSLLKRIALESLCHLGIALAVCLTRHCQVHTYLSSLAHEVRVQVFLHLCVGIFGYADYVLASECQACVLVNGLPGYYLFALRATLRCLCALKDESANRANKFLVHCCKVLFNVD